VQVFFVLSGFLITTLMLREVRRTGRLHLGHFYLRRALRIVPVYLSYLSFVAVFQSTGQVHLQTGNWIAAATYTVNLVPGPIPSLLSHFWSLCVEEHFYLLWPLLMALLPLHACRRAVLVCLAGALVARWVVLLAFPRAAVDLLTFTRIDDIAFGCGLAFLAHDRVWRARLDRLTASGRSLSLMCAGFLVAQVLFSHQIGGRLLPGAALPIGIGLANDVNAFTIAVFMWYVLTRPEGFWGRLLNHPVAVLLGVLSYSAYLWHLPLCEKTPAWLGSFPQNLPVIFAAAWLSYRLIEKPFLSLKDRLAADAPRPPRTLESATGVADLAPSPMLDGEVCSQAGRARRSRASEARNSLSPSHSSRDRQRVAGDGGR
jgi:peptidoglycan/LPS O-acetylase OafA/YrhL